MKKPVSFLLSAGLILVAVVLLQSPQPSLACIGSVCQLQQLQIGAGVFLLSGQAQYFPPGDDGIGIDPRYFDKTYNLHIHSRQDEGRFHSAFIKIVDKHYFTIATPEFENGVATFSGIQLVSTGNVKTSDEEEMEKLLHIIADNIQSVHTDGTRHIFQGLNTSNIVCNRVPAL